MPLLFLDEVCESDYESRFALRVIWRCFSLCCFPLACSSKISSTTRAADLMISLYIRFSTIEPFYFSCTWTVSAISSFTRKGQENSPSKLASITYCIGIMETILKLLLNALPTINQCIHLFLSSFLRGNYSNKIWRVRWEKGLRQAANERVKKKQCFSGNYFESN